MLVKLDDLLNVVQPLGLFTDSQILDAVKKQRGASPLPHRYVGASDHLDCRCVPEVNLASLELNAKVESARSSFCFVGTISLQIVEGSPNKGSQLLRGDSDIGEHSTYCCHLINEPGSGIVVMLGAVYLLNRVQMLLWDQELFYSYYVEVNTRRPFHKNNSIEPLNDASVQLSVDRQNWERVADRTNDGCRGLQTLTFAQIAARFVRVVGTRSTSYVVFNWST